MEFYPGHTYHVYNQGNNRESIFFEEKNYLFFLEKMKKKLLPHCDILAWCLMPNHFHWLLQVNDDYINKTSLQNKAKIVNPLNRSIGTLQSSYTRAINNRYGRSGSLFRQQTKAKSLSENRDERNGYGINCFLYIHQNPLRAGLVNKLEDWRYSSFRDYCGLRNGKLCNLELGRKLFQLPENSTDFYELSYRTIPEHIIKQFL